jgi:hypothetical protein
MEKEDFPSISHIETMAQCGLGDSRQLGFAMFHNLSGKWKRTLYIL